LVVQVTGTVVLPDVVHGHRNMYEIHIKYVHIIDTVHLAGIKKVSDAIKNAQNRKLANTSWDN
jgi:hypothetical protein